MLVGHIVGSINGSADNLGGFQNAKEMLIFFCFPISTIAGLALAWKREGLGGAITILGMLVLFVLRPDLLSARFILILSAPGFLFLFYWFQSEKRQC